MYKRQSLAYSECCGDHVHAAQPGMDLVVDADSDSEIGDDDEECFGDFKYGFDFFNFKPTSNSSSSNQ